MSKRRRKQRNLFQGDEEEIQNPLEQQYTIGNKLQSHTQGKFNTKQLQENKWFNGQKEKEKTQNEQHEQQNEDKEDINDNQNITSKLRKKRNFKERNKDFLEFQNDEVQNNIFTQKTKQQQAPLDNQDFKSSLYLNQYHEKVQQSRQSQQQNQKSQSSQDHDVVNMVKAQQKKTKLSQQTPLFSFREKLDKIGNKPEVKRLLYLTPLIQDQRAVCYFKRYQSGLSETYQLIGDDYRPLMFCENQRGSIGCNMYISMTKQMDKNSPNYLGKLRGNSTGSVYQLYDSGQQPNNKIDRSKWRISMATIQYENNFMGLKGPRKLKTIIPKINSEDDFDSFKLAQSQLLENFPKTVTHHFRNKQPKWNEKLKSYALNFGGRVKMPSIKNFILIDDNLDPQEELGAKNSLIFGKIDENTFSLEFGQPFCLFQAFGIAMSQFDFKIHCQ